jgi:hypothetical protein
MADANLTPERARELLDYNPETGSFTWRVKVNKRWPAGMLAGRINKNGYRYIKLGKMLLAHRLAWFFIHGNWPTASIDHINGERDDNRISNLRVVSTATNNQNLRSAKPNSLSGLLGASKNHGKWTASIKVGGRYHYLGSFSTPEEAHQRYLAAKRQLHEGCTI